MRLIPAGPPNSRRRPRSASLTQPDDNDQEEADLPPIVKAAQRADQP